jgi:hypothetical protein
MTRQDAMTAGIVTATVRVAAVLLSTTALGRAIRR